MLKNLAGLLVGGMTKMQDNTIPFGRSAYEIVMDVVMEYNYPVCFDFPAGHIKDNRAMIFGREVQLNVEENVTTLNF